MKALYKWGIIALVCIGAIAAWLFWSSSDEEEVRLMTSTVVRDNFVNKVQATGTLEPQELVDVGAQVTGEVVELGVDTEGRVVDYGSEVKEGQLLARIDDTIVELDIKRAQASMDQAEAQIQTAKANIAQATANLNKAKRDKERADMMHSGDISKEELDKIATTLETSEAALQTAQAQLATAEAQKKNAEAQLASQERNRAYTEIKSPVDGTIIVRQVNKGQTVVSSMNATTLFLVAKDLTHMQIWTSVNEADIAKIHAGQKVRYTVDALPNETFEGVVNKIRPNATMSSNVVTYIVEVDIVNPDRKLLPYMSANANFIVEEVENCLMVENKALLFQPEENLIAPEYRGKKPDLKRGERVVWKKTGKNQVAPVVVRTAQTNGTRTVVTVVDGKLTEEDQLVTGVMMMTGKDGADNASGNGKKNPFGMEGPKRRQPSTGGAEAKPGQSAKNDRPGPPM